MFIHIMAINTLMVKFIIVPKNMHVLSFTLPGLYIYAIKVLSFISIPNEFENSMIIEIIRYCFHFSNIFFAVIAYIGFIKAIN